MIIESGTEKLEIGLILNYNRLQFKFQGEEAHFKRNNENFSEWNSVFNNNNNNSDSWYFFTFRINPKGTDNSACKVYIYNDNNQNSLSIESDRNFGKRDFFTQDNYTVKLGKGDSWGKRFSGAKMYDLRLFNKSLGSFLLTLIYSSNCSTTIFVRALSLGLDTFFLFKTWISTLAKSLLLYKFFILAL